MRNLVAKFVMATALCALPTAAQAQELPRMLFQDEVFVLCAYGPPLKCEELSERGLIAHGATPSQREEVARLVKFAERESLQVEELIEAFGPPAALLPLDETVGYFWPEEFGSRPPSERFFFLNLEGTRPTGLGYVVTDKWRVQWVAGPAVPANPALAKPRRKSKLNGP